MSESKKLKTIGWAGAIFWIILTVILLFIGLVKQPYSHTLTYEYVKGVCESKFFTNLGFALSPFVSIFIFVAIMGHTRKDTDPVSGRSILVIIICIVLFAALDAAVKPYAKTAMNIKTNEPRIDAVTVTAIDKLVIKRSRRHDTTIRYAVFSNGTTIELKMDLYGKYSVSVGDEFYLIMCGDSCIEYYAVDQYSLP